MKKKCCLFLTACVMAVLLLGGCGKTEEEEKVQENMQEQAGETEGEEEKEQAEETSQAERTEQSAGIMFEAQDLEGNVVTESIFTESELTMINVWATYCNPCLSEMPGLGELAGEYDKEQFQIIGIISDVLEDADEEMMEYAAALISKTGADYSHLLLNESLYIALLRDVSAVPTTFFVDENGEVLDTVIGAMDKSAWEEKINAFLEE